MAAFGRYRRYWISGLLIFFVCFYSYSVDTEEKKEILSPEDTIMTFIEKRNTLNEKLDKQLEEILSLMGVQSDNNL